MPYGFKVEIKGPSLVLQYKAKIKSPQALKQHSLSIMMLRIIVSR